MSGRKDMDAVFRIPKEKYAGIRNAVMSNDLLSRQSLTFRDSTALGVKEEGYYLLIEGPEEAIEEARKVLKEATELKGGEADEIRKKIKSQEESAAAGFGSIFG